MPPTGSAVAGSGAAASAAPDLATPTLDPFTPPALAFDFGAASGSGASGWRPVLGVVVDDGNRVAVAVVDWVGGDGTKPSIPTPIPLPLSPSWRMDSTVITMDSAAVTMDSDSSTSGGGGTGEQGPQGPAGPPGPRGLQGLPGASALDALSWRVEDFTLVPPVTTPGVTTVKTARTAPRPIVEATGAVDVEYSALFYSPSVGATEAPEQVRQYMVTADATLTLYPPDAATLGVWRRHLILYFIKADNTTRSVTVRSAARTPSAAALASLSFSDRRTALRVSLVWEVSALDWQVTSTALVPTWGMPSPLSTIVPVLVSNEAAGYAYDTAVAAVGFMPSGVRTRVMAANPLQDIQVAHSSIKYSPALAPFRASHTSFDGFQGFTVPTSAVVIAPAPYTFPAFPAELTQYEIVLLQGVLIHEFGHTMDFWLWSAGKTLTTPSGTAETVRKISDSSRLLALYNAVIAETVSGDADTYARQNAMEFWAQLWRAYVYVDALYPPSRPTLPRLTVLQVCNNNAARAAAAVSFIESFVLVP